MIRSGDTKCTTREGSLKPYGSTKRVVIGKYGKKRTIKIKRYKCTRCGVIHNKLPECVTPYVRYETDIFVGVVDGLITSDTLGFEDYPNELTMKRWLKRLQLCNPL